MRLTNPQQILPNRQIWPTPYPVGHGGRPSITFVAKPPPEWMDGCSFPMLINMKYFTFLPALLLGLLPGEYCSSFPSPPLLPSLTKRPHLQEVGGGDGEVEWKSSPAQLVRRKVKYQQQRGKSIHPLPGHLAKEHHPQ
jgi:hypothetical protein